MPSGVYERTEKIKESTAKNGFQKGCSAWNKGKSFQRRRALKAGAEGSHTFGEWETLKKQCGNKCLMCGEIEPNIKLTEDHIVPLSKGGTDYIENIQPLCLACNTRKHTKVINFLGGGELF
jgi:5-methylcytosine-specific restriction endonuclease McrA